MFQRFLQTLKLIHISLFIGLTLFSVFAYVQNQGFNADINSDSKLLFIVPVVALLGYFGSQVLFKKMINKVRQSQTLQVKLNQYQVASIIKYALIEGPAFIALFVYLATGNALPLVIAVCLLAYFFVQRPTKDKISDTLRLNSEERRSLGDK